MAYLPSRIVARRERAWQVYTRWLNGESMQVIAYDLGVSKQRVHQLIESARLREKFPARKDEVTA